MNARPLLEVANLGIDFRTDEGRITAVEEVSFTLRPGETLGLVGESGSGKSVTTRALMGLLAENAILAPESQVDVACGDERYDVAALNANDPIFKKLRGGVFSMIFQEPMASFSPLRTIGAHMVEALRLQERVSRKEAKDRAIALLERVGIADAPRRFSEHSFELSGGMRQRAMIAMALIAEPKILIADEPTTALDVTIQAQVLSLLKELQRDLDMAMIFITHDLGVIAQVADEVAVMYLGRIVERGPTRAVVGSPLHPYTKGLLRALPSLDHRKKRLEPVPGDIPSPLQRPTGCPFHTRCADALPGRCAQPPTPLHDAGGGHSARCVLYGDAA